MLGSRRILVLFSRVLLLGSNHHSLSFGGATTERVGYGRASCLPLIPYVGFGKDVSLVFPGTFVGFGYHSPSLGGATTERVEYDF